MSCNVKIVEGNLVCNVCVNVKDVSSNSTVTAPESVPIKLKWSSA